METPVQQAARLIASLNDLIDQEGMHLRSGAYDLANEIRERAAPIVSRLVELSSIPGVAEFRHQVMALVVRSAGHSNLLQQRMVELGAEIKRTDQARHRASQMAPAYFRPPGATAPRFLAAG